MNKSSIPNSMTFGNLACGVLSISISSQGNYKFAAAFILLAGILDRYDGMVARLLNVDSEIGKQLDSLADLVSFGVAPSLLAYNLYDFHRLGLIGYIFLIIFPLAGAFRLARFNCSNVHDVYTGVPITIGGSLMAIFALVTEQIRISIYIPLILILCFSYLMISRVQVKKR